MRFFSTLHSQHFGLIYVQVYIGLHYPDRVDQDLLSQRTAGRVAHVQVTGSL